MGKLTVRALCAVLVVVLTGTVFVQAFGGVGAGQRA